MDDGFDRLRYRSEQDVATITLARPEKRNALDLQAFDELGRAAARAADDPEVRVIVVRGDGPSFCAGIDVGVFVEVTPGGRDAFDRLVRLAQHPFHLLATNPKPVIASVQGHALGAGFQLALAADLRVVAPDVSFGMLELRYGIVPDLGGNHRLSALVGPARAKELIWTARQVDADEALRIGLANRVVPPDRLEAETEALAAQLAAAAPLPVRHVKVLVDRAAESGLEASMERERQAQAVCMGSDDAAEALAASLERRPPRFTGR